MYLMNDPMPGCVPEYYRERQEEQDRQYDLAMQRKAHYLANRQKLGEAAEAGLPVLDFGGYGPCRECPSADHDTAISDDDDFCSVICRNPACPEHMKRRTE